MAPHEPDPYFHTTRWSLVARAGGKGEEARRSLGELLGAYWPPLYGWLRRTGTPAPDAQDLVQGLFARLIEKDELARIDADPGRGRFRSFMLTALQDFAANERKKANAWKRGGKAHIIALDPERIESSGGRLYGHTIALLAAFAPALLVFDVLALQLVQAVFQDVPRWLQVALVLGILYLNYRFIEGQRPRPRRG